MEKKYQVFVSSTYLDLVEERKEVIQALLELDCMPIGMELFPAADENQWEFIKSVIDDCDYYVLILAGRYGSCADNGVGYTEMEYQYALDIGKPIIAFLHSDPGTIPANMTDTDPQLVEKLGKFRSLAQKKLCKFWKTPTELGGVLGRSIVQLKKRSPAVGWVKADNVPDEGATQEILRLKNQIERLREELAEAQLQTGVEISELAQGDDKFELDVKVKGTFDYYSDFKGSEEIITSSVSWNQIFAELAPLLIDEATENELKVRLNQFLAKFESSVISEFEWYNACESYSCIISRTNFETIIVQLRALNLIQKGKRNRSVKDNSTYWCLTEHGDHVMVGLRAIKKEC
ncbi:TPA: DUF4062 domain-containing protein [Vibrio vulnificus]